MPLGKEVGLVPGHIVLDGDPAPTAAPPHFWPMRIVAKRSPILATAKLLLRYLSEPFLGILRLSPSYLTTCYTCHCVQL